MSRELMRQILMLYQVCYPMLSVWCQKTSKIIALVIDNMQEAKKIINEVGVRPIIIDDSMTVPTAKKQIRCCNSRGIFMMISKGKSTTHKCREKFDVLSGIANIGMVDGTRTSSAVFIVCEDVIPDYAENIFQIRVSDLTLEKEADDLKFNPSPKDITKYQTMLEMDENHENMSILAYAAWLYGRINEKVLGLKANQLVKEMVELEQVLEERSNEEELYELICKWIIKCSNESKFDEWYELPNLETDAINKMSRAVFLEKNYMYISEEYFWELCAPLKDYASTNQIRRIMKSNEMIKTYNKGYTVKMQYFNAFGGVFTKSMLALDLTKIIMPSGESLRVIFNY